MLDTTVCVVEGNAWCCFVNGIGTEGQFKTTQGAITIGVMVA
jgi:hypothetical protein